MKKIIIAIFILSVVLFAAIKGSLWYFTQEFVKNQIIQAKPFAEISYKEIKSSFTGSTTISGITVSIPLINETLRIKSIQLIAPDLITLLTLNSQLEKNKLPASLSFLISGLSLDLNSDLMKKLDDPDIEPTLIETLSTLACGDVNRIGSNALSKMGYDTISNNIIFNYNFNSHNNTLNYKLKNHILDMTEINLSGTIRGVTDLNSLKEKEVQFGKVALEIIDDSYIKQKNKFCAKQGKRTVNKYINEHILQIEEYLLSYGVMPEDGLLNAYKAFIERPESIVIEANLAQLTGTSELISFQPNDFIQFIQLKLFVNDKRINEISIHIDKEKLIENTHSENITIETPNEIRKKQAVKIKRYQIVSAANLQNFIGFRVKIETTAGKIHKGTLKIEKPGTFEIISRFRSGYISYFVPVNKIKKAHVFKL